jgi:hypothetical protein
VRHDLVKATFVSLNCYFKFLRYHIVKKSQPNLFN